MNRILPMLACCVLASCAHPRYSMPWAPITDPIFKEVYGEKAPTVESIFGGKEGLALLDKPDSVTVIRLRSMKQNDQTEKATLFGFFIPVGPGKPIGPEQYQPLLTALHDPENLGGEFLGLTRADFGFKVISGTNALGIVFELETPSMTIFRMQQRQDKYITRVAASLELVRARDRLVQHL